MLNKKNYITLLIILFAGSLFFANNIHAQQTRLQRFKVEGGVLSEILPTAQEDSLAFAQRQEQLKLDSLARAADTLSRRQYKKLLRQDSTIIRYNKIFKDTIPISRMTLISAVVPGFGQFYNEQYWKIPIAYGTIGTSLAGALIQNKKYQVYKTEYDALQRVNASRDEIDPVQSDMIKYNTRRQLMFGALVASYAYFLGDAVLNYSGVTTNVKKATTLSTIFPGAGQIYNKSYWKVPIVLGGIATFAFVIDYNSRGYKRFTLAYDLLTDGDDSTVDEFGGIYSESFIDNYRDSYRRNRDLGVILMAGWYLLNIIDAHVEAHFKHYDISDDLSFEVMPYLGNYYTQKNGSSNTYGLSLNIKF